MKKFFHKNLIAVIVLALVVGGTATVGATIKAQSVDPGDNPIDGISMDNKQVMVTGKGYKLSKKQARQHQLQQKAKEVEETTAATTSSKVPTAGSSRYSSIKTTTKKLDYTPTISTDLKDNPVYTRSETFTFWVEGKSYLKASIDAKNYVVTLNGDEITGTGSKTHQTYSVQLLNEENVIKIKVTDPIKKKSVTETYKIAELLGDVSVSIDSPDIGITVGGNDVEVSKGDTIRTAIARMIKDTDLKVTYDKSGKKITKISGKSLNLSGASLSSEIKDKLSEEDSTEESTVEGDTDESSTEATSSSGDSATTLENTLKKKTTLSNGDLVKSSKWKIITTDSSGKTNTNASAKTKVTEGMTITIEFSLGL